MNEKLKKIVLGFTKGMIPKGDNKQKCFMVCLPLSGYLDFLGYENEIVKGEIKQGDTVWEHYWIKVKSLIIDPTASQFKKPNGSRMPKVYFGKKPKWYQKLP